MANYEEARVKLTNSQFKLRSTKVKSAAKYETGTTLKITKKKDEELSRELFLTTVQKTK